MRAIGYFLGVALGAPLLFFIISSIFLGPRKVIESQIDEYLKKSEKKLITEPIPLLTEYRGSDIRLGGDEISKMTYFSNRNMSYVRATTYTYFSKEFNKYIRTYSISEGYFGEVLLAFGDKDKDRTIWPDMYFYYNKTQNADPSYGTIDKPLPILHFRSANPALRSMRRNNRDSDSVYLKERYTENVKLYLEYFIEKEDFEKLFPEN
ncbi:hypothetical protein CGC56_07725 [Capnocytophaga canimorsus]|uniref:DUF8188 domain-containing protein n=2 Tax=Capnocytophaga canimorsus TaxID=28188 RepID=A0A250G3T9_9FLAO|nr:hypothetical protein [Capnocytophaga canimorsus]ATA92050.1 hypothetical protein CGC56_07725 [Capnocytophaga canimorsus]